MTLTAGTKLGPYQILSAIGAGGMGEVYRATDLRLDRTVAIKVLPADLAADPQLKARLEREARAISARSSPTTVTRETASPSSSSAAAISAAFVSAISPSMRSCPAENELQLFTE